MAKQSQTKSPPKRHCTSRTLAGKKCKAWALHGSDVCMAHSDAKTRQSAGFIAANGKAGRPKLPTPSEIARKLIEENELALQRPYWRTLGYDVRIGAEGPYLVELEDGGAKVFGESKDGIIKLSSVDDLGAMITAAEKLQDRVYGKATTRTEIKGEVTHIEQNEFDRRVAGLYEQMEKNANGAGKAPQKA